MLEDNIPSKSSEAANASAKATGSVPNRWNDSDAAACLDDLALRAYSSCLIGQDPRLVLQGGGNTSVKSAYTDCFGNVQDAIWVKASGFDLGQMGIEGFTGLLLKPLLKLATLSELSDSVMLNEVNRARLISDAASPSIEAIAHSVIPFKFVDHSHANAVVTISNTPNGNKVLEEIYGGKVLILPYVKPGFDLALQFVEVGALGQFTEFDAIILEHHGVFTFANDAKVAYMRMIEIVNQAETYLSDNFAKPASASPPKTVPIEIAKVRKEVSRVAGHAVLSLSVGQIAEADVAPMTELSRNGTLTPEHVIHNKPFPAVISSDAVVSIDDFAEEYIAYFEEGNDVGQKMHAPYPNWALFQSGEIRSFGRTLRKAQISRDIGEATIEALHFARLMGGWQGLNHKQLRDLEYWELEQQKLKRQRTLPELAGRIAVVSGSAAGIGKACAEALHDAGAVVIGMDINPPISEYINRDGYNSVQIDLTREYDVQKVIAEVVAEYGGLDMLVSNVGIFKTGDTVETLDDKVWDTTMAINLDSHRKLVKQAIPFMRHGIDPSIVFVGSRNVLAPGAGASAYSVSKAGLTQLARVLAFELARDRIRVNVVHPDAVFDTNLWTSEALERSAQRYQLTVEKYKTRNLMQSEVNSRHVGSAVVALLDKTFLRTTGAQIIVDGGNERVI